MENNNIKWGIYMNTTKKKIQKIWRDVTSEKGSKYFRILKKGTFHQK